MFNKVTIIPETVVRLTSTPAHNIISLIFHVKSNAAPLKDTALTIRAIAAMQML